MEASQAGQHKVPQGHWEPSKWVSSVEGTVSCTDSVSYSATAWNIVLPGKASQVHDAPAT